MFSLRLFKPASVLAKTPAKSAPKSRKLVIARAPKLNSFARLYASEAQHNATKLKLTLQTPSESIHLNYECTTVGVPGSVGEFAVAPNGAPIFAELAPGIIRVIDGTNETKYITSGGFFASDVDSNVSISVGECIKMEDIDIDAARKIAASSQAKMTSASTEEAKAIAQIGFDTASAIIKAYEAK